MPLYGFVAHTSDERISGSGKVSEKVGKCVKLYKPSRKTLYSLYYDPLPKVILCTALRDISYACIQAFPDRAPLWC